MGRYSKRFLLGEKLASGRGLYKTVFPAELFERANNPGAVALRSGRNQDAVLAVHEGVRHDA